VPSTRSDPEKREKDTPKMTNLTDVRGIGPVLAAEMTAAGIGSAEDLVKADPASLIAFKGVGAPKAEALIAAGHAAIAAAAPDATPSAAEDPVPAEELVGKSAKKKSKSKSDKKDKKKAKKKKSKKKPEKKKAAKKKKEKSGKRAKGKKKKK
jgi:hypothetical protein